LNINGKVQAFFGLNNSIKRKYCYLCERW